MTLTQNTEPIAKLPIMDTDEAMRMNPRQDAAEPIITKFATLNDPPNRPNALTLMVLPRCRRSIPLILEPARTTDLMLNELPRCANLITLVFSPMRAKLLTDRAEPTFTLLIILHLTHDPIASTPVILTPEPIRVKERTLIALPIVM
jgi:hypothetical protein